MEIFRPAFGVESHYAVSNFGNIRRTVGGKGTRLNRNFRKPRTGYHTVRLCIDGKPFTVAVHRLVVQTFIRPMLEGQCVNHLDGDPLNNRLENLEITSYAGNTQHAVDVLGWKPTIPRGPANGCALLTEEQAKYVKTLPRGYGSILKLAAEWNVRPSTLYSIRTGRNWRHV